MRRFHAPVQSARNFPRLCFLMRQRFQHADIYRRPRAELYPLFPHLYAPSTEVGAESAAIIKQNLFSCGRASAFGIGLS
jgi:hypothetical protein